MSFKPIDGKRDEFRKYLERTGVLEAVSKVFAKLLNCPERPENAIEFIRLNLGDTLQQGDTIESLRRELDNAKNEISQLKQTVEQLKAEKGLSAKPTTGNKSTESVDITNVTADEVQNNNDTTNNSSSNSFSSTGNSVTENSKGDNNTESTGTGIGENDVEQQVREEESVQLTNGNDGDGGGTIGDCTDLNNSSVGTSPLISVTVPPTSNEQSSAQSDSEPNKATAEGK